MDTAIEETTMSFPTGWFQVAWSGELVPGAVLPLRYFSREMVCFRDGQGRARVLDAHCLQCGSHLGYGGTTCEQGIVCPLDGWVWDGAGVNTRIPGRTDVFTDDQVTAWATQEVNGCVVVWFDSAGRAPFWEPPVMPDATDPAFYPMYPHGAHRDVVRFPPQFFVENAADMPH
jgi:phenylpropionate dioxygenase-like ring-hydroxylating dioxygenase large terminal subunit